MIHEFISIIEQAHQAWKQNKRCVLATIVHLDGSSYRKEGTRMLIKEDGSMQFELSGGCIEQEVFQHSTSVFSSQIPKVIEYDGTVRLGCEGTLHILLEPIQIDEEKYKFFNQLFLNKESFELNSHFNKKHLETGDFGTIARTQDGRKCKLYKDFSESDNENCFTQVMPAQFSLTLFGSGQDVAIFSQLASSIGWSVTVVLCENTPKKVKDFPFASKVLKFEEWKMNLDLLAGKSAAVVMSHNFKNDKSYLSFLLQKNLMYIGIIGSVKRKTKLEDELKINLDTHSHVYMPAGLDIGALTPEEIALSIVSEILAIARNASTSHLHLTKNKKLVS